MATEFPILDQWIVWIPFVIAILGLAFIIVVLWKPGWQQRQEAEARRAMLMAEAGLKADHFDAPPEPKPSGGFVEMLLKWKFFLAAARKPDELPIFIPDEGWEEFAKAVRSILPKHLRELLIDDASIMTGEIKILGFKLVRLNHMSQLTPQSGDISWIPRHQTKDRPSASPKRKPRSPPKPRRKSPKKASKRR